MTSRLLLTCILLLTASVILSIPGAEARAQGDFSTSLHATRAGKAYWYDQGFGLLTGIPIGDLGCRGCHGPTNADGNAYGPDYKPGCVDCHPTGNFDRSALSVDQCLGCHGRQATEANTLALGDVHRDEGLECWDCHRASEMHGDGTEYDSMLQPGAITSDCVDCHGDLPSSHDASDPHEGRLHCSACHSSTVISCYNCHFESQVEAHVKRAKQPISGFVLLVNRAKDGKVYTASLQSLSYEGKTFVAFAPYYAHTVMEEGRRCVACHVNLGGSNAAIEEYNRTGMIQFARWNSADSTLAWKKGVVPMPEDYASSFRMDFITYDGDVADPAGPSKNWSFVEGEWDDHHMLFATPLTRTQMAKLGMQLTSVREVGPARDFSLAPNFPNPFGPGSGTGGSATAITYSIAREGMVELCVHDLRGAVVRRIVSRRQRPGTYVVEFDAGRLEAGVYLAVLRSGEQTRTRKLVLLR